MNTNDLYLEYARVIQMCKGTELEDTPWACVKYFNYSFVEFSKHPDFPVLEHPSRKWHFAVAVLEGKPVWVGDKVFIRNNKYPEVNWKLFDYWKNDIAILSKDWKWTPPKRTFTLNGAELPCPVTFLKESDERHMIQIHNNSFYYKSGDEYDQVTSALIRILTEARDKP